MHCPQCGQQQVSGDTKFCSRCGFQLGLVSELLANGGVLPQLAELYSGKRKLFTRKNGVIFSILWFILFVMMIPAFFGLADFEEGAAVSAIFGVFSSLMLVIASLAFLKASSKKYELPPMERHAPMPATLHGNPNYGSLPPQPPPAASTYAAPQGGWRAPDTGDLVERGSVIENTTKLLKRDE